MKNSQSDFTKNWLINPYIKFIITDKEKKQAPPLLSENELRKLSAEALDKYNSELIKESAQTFADSLDFYDFK